MSPEQILQRPITPASDVFSQGVVLYELASGTNPFLGDSAGVRLLRVKELPDTREPEQLFRTHDRIFQPGSK